MTCGKSMGSACIYGKSVHLPIIIKGNPNLPKLTCETRDFYQVSGK